jgi:CheY-like chemotaxis protein
MADLLRETDLTGEQQLYAETIRNSGEALLVIINDILDYSKIDAGKLVLHAEVFDLQQMVQEIFQLMRPGLEGKALELELDYDRRLPTRVVGDRGRVRQVLTNLIGNAVKFTQAGRVIVRVAGAPHADARDEVPIHVEVEDTGIGIPPEMQAHVFGEFNQVEAEANRRFDGTGLGLAITRRLIEMMGGEIWLTSQPGVGSCFGFALRLGAAAGDVSGDGAADGAQDDVADIPVPPTRLRLLAAEDNKTNQLVFRAMLKGLDLELELVENGAQLVAAACRAAPDVIFTDISMPEMDGLEAARALRAHAAERGLPRVPIVAMTAHAMEGDRERILAAGIDAYLTKPLKKAEVHGMIRDFAPEGLCPVPEAPRLDATG